MPLSPTRLSEALRELVDVGYGEFVMSCTAKNRARISAARVRDSTGFANIYFGTFCFSIRKMTE
jgi:hypothetical protein